MASQQATANRRANRRAWRETQRRRQEARNRQTLGIPISGDRQTAWAERQRKDREAAARLCAKFFRDPRNPKSLILPTPIVLLYDYWQAKACGWDVLTREYARDYSDRPCAPSDSWTWNWWEGLHHKQRYQIRAAIRSNLMRKRRAG